MACGEAWRGVPEWNGPIHGPAHVRVNVSIVPHVDGVRTTRREGPSRHGDEHDPERLSPGTFDVENAVSCKGIVHQNCAERRDLKQDDDSKFHELSHDLEQTRMGERFRGALAHSCSPVGFSV